jgi:Na+-transporting methylmalonyl-CoA/oxaloacetate decarboxylase gamma subunit
MFTPLLAKLPAHPLFSDALNFILTGFVLVIGALLILSGLIAATGKYFKAREAENLRKRQSRKVAVANPLAEVDAVPSSARRDDSPALAAVIAAAVHVALEGQAHRVIHIEPAGVGWAREGRREIFSSHRVR